MCIIISKPKGIALTKELYQTCWDNNPDGSGFFWHDGVIHVRKAFGKFDTFWNQLSELRQEDYSIVFHFRWGTHGEKSLRNCHPVIMKKHGMVVCHNGVISKASYNKVKSDTVMFVEEILEKLPRDFLHNPAIVALIEEYVGVSKLVFMEANGKILGLNCKSGVEALGCWFSNSGYLEKKSRATGWTPPTLCSCCGKLSPAGYTTLCDWCRTHGVWDATAYKYCLPEDKPLPLCPICKKEVSAVGRWCDTCLKTISSKSKKDTLLKEGDDIWFVKHTDSTKPAESTVGVWKIGEKCQYCKSYFYDGVEEWLVLNSAGKAHWARKTCFSLTDPSAKIDVPKIGDKLYFMYPHAGYASLEMGEEVEFRQVSLLTVANAPKEWMVWRSKKRHMIWLPADCFSVLPPDKTLLLPTPDATDTQTKTSDATKYDGDV